MSQYLISFQAGTSGRFIAGLLHNWILGIFNDYTYSQFNSAHHNNDYTRCYDLSNFDDATTFYKNPDIYNIFKFNIIEPSILSSHVFPNFSDILSNFTNPKVIIITYREDDINEVTLNSLFKNGFEELIYNRPLNSNAKFIQSAYSVLLKKQYDPNIKLTQEEIKKICNLYCIHSRKDMQVSKFINLSENIIPEQYSKYTTIINYKDLISRKDCVLSTLSNIIEKNITPEVIQQYDSYLDNRKQFIQTYMPWIDK